MYDCLSFTLFLRNSTRAVSVRDKPQSIVEFCFATPLQSCALPFLKKFRCSSSPVEDNCANDLLLMNTSQRKVSASFSSHFSTFPYYLGFSLKTQCIRIFDKRWQYPTPFMDEHNVKQERSLSFDVFPSAYVFFCRTTRGFLWRRSAFVPSSRPLVKDSNTQCP